MRVLAWLLVPRRRHDAAVGDVADHVFELNGGVIDTKAIAQLVPNLQQDALAGGRRNVSDADVAGKRVRIRADAPHMQVMDVVYPGDGGEGGGNVFQFHAAGRALQQDVKALAHYAKGGP